MNIVIFGTGFAGTAIARELTGRGHHVTAVSRSGNRELPEGVASVTGSVHEPAFVDSATSGADAIVSALPALSPDGDLDTSVTALLRAARTGGARLGVVGGAAVVPTEPGGPRLVDTPEFPAKAAPVVEAHQRALDVLNSAPKGVDWFYLVPALEFGAHAPGTRTGSYRTSDTALVRNDEGRSAIGGADYAIAFADELENPRTHRGWLAIGY
ncbi:NAD(P)H-binding protein [Micromonospora sp. NPDC049559]|uniref:NAD(P)-dependent oxidoreductase n=1 Tax=Micromonospora sp. NPDC049559 TaxID=3155923 RepID=UPI00343FC7BC